MRNPRTTTMHVNGLVILVTGLISLLVHEVQGSYEKGILENTVSRVLDKVPVLGQRIHEIRDSSCSICAKQALQRCPLEILKSKKENGTDDDVSMEEIHQALQTNPNRFMGLMRNIVSTMHVQSKIDLDRAKEKEAKNKMKRIQDRVIDSLNRVIRR